MMKHLSENMKGILIESLNQKYDFINKKLQMDFCKMHYEQYQIEQMKKELKYIEELIEKIMGD